MKPRATSGVFLFVTLYQLCFCNQNCVSPQPGKCSRDNYSVDGNEVCEVNGGSCDFNNRSSGLCLYQQGCADPHMSNWTLQGDHVQARQQPNGSCGGDYYYSVLESPWLHVPHPSCLKFSYSRESPAALDVFLDHRDGRISTVLNRSNDNAGYNVRSDVARNVDPGVRKVIFRAYGGGGEGGGAGRVKVFSVSVDPSLCTWSDKLFVNSTSSGDELQWTSPLISPTESNGMDCLWFTYFLPSSSNLTVSVQLLDENRTVAVWRDSTPGGNLNGVCPLQVRAAYKILFKVEKQPSSTGQVSVVVTQFSRHQRTGGCSVFPSTAVTSSSNSVVRPSVLSQPPAVTQCSIPSSSAAVSTSPVSSPPTSTASGTTLKGSSHSQDHSTSATTNEQTTATTTETSSTAQPTNGAHQDQQEDSNAGAIGGGVAAAIIIIAVVVIVAVIIVLRRRRQQKGNKGKRTATAMNIKTDENPATPPKNKIPATSSENNNNDYTGNHAPQFTPAIPLEDGDYSLLAQCQTPDILITETDPYEVVPDPVDESAQSPGEDDYHRITAGGFLDTALPPGPVNGDYHHINSPRNLPEPETDYTYTQVWKGGRTTGQPGPGAVGSESMGAVEVLPEPWPSHVYCQVNKKPKKPDIAPKPAQQKPAGNATSAKENRSYSSEWSTPADPYNIMNTPSTKTNGANKDGDDVEDEYNTLKRDDPQQALADDGGTNFKFYDHVRKNPDDDYSTCNDGKRNVVIDSGYDHVKLKKGSDHVGL